MPENPLAPDDTRTEPRRAGLRERKRLKTRDTIRRSALELFQQRGFESTTVQEIAELAEVSESTLFRYFPTKEDLVLDDDLDPLLTAAIRSQPSELSDLDALRAAFRSVFAALGTEEELAQMRERIVLVTGVPSLRARMLDQFFQDAVLLADTLAERRGRSRSDFGTRVLAGAVIGGFFMAMLDALDRDEDLPSVLDEALRGLTGALSEQTPAP